MKKIGIIFIVMLNLVSCSNDDKKSPDASDYHGKWTLIKMTGIKNANVIFDSLEWQETYVFNTDGTFVKTRIKDNKTTIATGNFTMTNADNVKHFELNYKESNAIIGSCFGNLTESLYINTDNLLVGLWQVCDGPGLIYKKLK